MYVKNTEVIYFDSFGVEYFSKEIKRFIGHKNIKTNIFTLQADTSIMCELNSKEIPLNDQTKFRLSEVNKVKDYFNSEIQERKIMSKKLSKYIVIAAFDYIDKTLIVLSGTSGRISIISFTSVIGITAGLANASFFVTFSLTTGLIKKLLKVTRKKKKKHNKIVILAKSELNSIETLMSEALIDLDISHKEFKTIVNEKDE